MTTSSNITKVTRPLGKVLYEKTLFNVPESSILTIDSYCIYNPSNDTLHFKGVSAFIPMAHEDTYFSDMMDTIATNYNNDTDIVYLQHILTILYEHHLESPHRVLYSVNLKTGKCQYTLSSLEHGHILETIDTDEKLDKCILSRAMFTATTMR